jgi:hypothetical protein
MISCNPLFLRLIQLRTEVTQGCHSGDPNLSGESGIFAFENILDSGQARMITINEFA